LKLINRFVAWLCSNSCLRRKIKKYIWLNPPTHVSIYTIPQTQTGSDATIVSRSYGISTRVALYNDGRYYGNYLPIIRRSFFGRFRERKETRERDVTIWTKREESSAAVCNNKRWLAFPYIDNIIIIYYYYHPSRLCNNNIRSPSPQFVGLLNIVGFYMRPTNSACAPTSVRARTNITVVVCIV